MKVLQRIFDFYINSSIHVALAVVALTQITLLEYGESASWTLLLFNFFSTIVGYNFVKYSSISKLHYRQFTRSIREIEILTIFSSVAMLFLFLKLSSTVMVCLLFLGVLTMFYVVPIFPNNKSLRRLSGVKVFIIGIVWVGVTFVLPILEIDQGFDRNIVVSIVQRFILIFVLMLPFEIRDLQYDDLRLATIPQQLGTFKTKGFGIFLMLLFVVLETFKESTLVLVAFLNASIIAILAILFLVFAKESQSKYYSSFWVESLPVLWLVSQVVIHSIG